MNRGISQSSPMKKEAGGKFHPRDAKLAGGRDYLSFSLKLKCAQYLSGRCLLKSAAATRPAISRLEDPPPPSPLPPPRGPPNEEAAYLCCFTHATSETLLAKKKKKQKAAKPRQQYSIFFFFRTLFSESH